MNSTDVGVSSDLEVECSLCGHDVTPLRLHLMKETFFLFCAWVQRQAASALTAASIHLLLFVVKMHSEIFV